MNRLQYIKDFASKLSDKRSKMLKDKKSSKPKAMSREELQGMLNESYYNDESWPKWMKLKYIKKG